MSANGLFLIGTRGTPPGQKTTMETTASSSSVLDCCLTGRLLGPQVGGGDVSYDMRLEPAIG